MSASSMLLLLFLFTTVTSLQVTAVNSDSKISSETSLKYAGGKTVIGERNYDPNYKKDAPCAFCKFFVEKFQQYLESPAVMYQLYNTLLGTCEKILPVTAACQKLSEEIIHLVKKMIDSEMSPAKACLSAGFCKQGDWLGVSGVRDTAALVALVGPLDQHGDKLVCDVCKLVVARVDLYLLDQLNKTKSAAHDFCQRLTPPSDQQCLKVVDSYFKEFSKYLEDGGIFGPIGVCKKEIHVCDSSYQ